jgi:hypothetical protein
MLSNVTWSWKYEIGDLLCCPRGNADNVWGTLIVTKRIVKSTIKYYECYSQKANRVIDMPKKALEKGWYVPKEKDKESA